ncbi:MAG: virulence protein RhuM/Fic/DOC family protein [Alphaproteobacteria bacterium]|nr:virulence protein RhuM/Fic/DOC family protein [Alphaproteobacteria bacterium]
MSNSLEIIYESYACIDVQIDRKNETVWLNKNEIAELFEIDRSGVSRHINNIFNQEELDKKSNVQKMHIPNSDRPVEFFSLDVVLAVGYRANSAKASAFRRWVSTVLKKYLVDGYALNEKRLQEQKSKVAQLQNAIRLLNRSIEHQADNLDEAKKFSALMADFAAGLDLLDDYDNKTLDTKGKTVKPAVVVTKEEFLSVIDKMKPAFASAVFANPKDDSFDSSVNQIYQTFGGRDCYPALEEKAAMLLYFVVKNHGFSDGNKRIGAACFLYFLDRNGILYRNGAPVIDNATLFALTVLIAESKPEEMETMKQIVISILNGKKSGK